MSLNIQKLHKIAFLIVISLILAACSTGDFTNPFESSSSENRARRYDNPQLASSREPTRAPKLMKQEIPWQLWSPRRGYRGGKISSPLILEGDQLFISGDLKGALAKYQEARKSLSSDPAMQVEAVFRSASTLLSLKQAATALTEASSFFTSQQLGVDAVGSEFAILFGYAYSMSRDDDQALSWFSHGITVSKGRGALAERARSGAMSVLQSLPEARFENTAKQWKSDPYIGELFGKERRMRSLGVNPDSTLALNTYGDPNSSLTQVPQNFGSFKVGALLPLSGQFSALGQRTLNGMKIAFGANLDNKDALPIVIRDTGSDPYLASHLAVELVEAEGVSAIVGPLISTQAEEAARVARDMHVPTITLSKSSEFFPGGGVFRLGPTIETQVRSLVEVAVRERGLNRIALIYPQTDTGIAYSSAFRQALLDLGTQPVFERAYTRPEPGDLLRIGEELLLSSPDGVFFADDITAAARFFSSLPLSFRDTVTPLGTSLWDDPIKLRNSANALKGALLPSLFLSASQNPLIKQFRESYQAMYGEPADFFAAQGFDTAALLLAGYRSAGDGDKTKLEQAISGVGSFEGLTGTIYVTQSGEIERRFRVAEFSRGVFKEFGAEPQQVLAPAAPAYAGH